MSGDIAIIGAGLGGLTCALALVKAGQAERGSFRLEMAHRVRIKCGNQGRHATRARLGNGGTNHGLMPGMDAIKIAQRHHTAAKCVGDGGISV